MPLSTIPHPDVHRARGAQGEGNVAEVQEAKAARKDIARKAVATAIATAEMVTVTIIEEVEKTDNNPKGVNRSEEEWRALLDDESYRVMRQAGTERPFTGEYNLFFESGTYCCKGCGTPLFTSESKFESGCGWPSFDREIARGTIKEVQDRSHGMIRTEIRCGTCDSHLGHVFPDGPTSTGTRYCVNSVCLKFNPED